MTNLQLALSIGIPVGLILAGMFFNWSAANGIRTEVKDLHTEMNSRFTQLDGRIDRIHETLGHFHSVNGQYGARLDALEKQ